MATKPRRVYIAGPLYNPHERKCLERIDKLCKRYGFSTYLPHRDAGLIKSYRDFKKIFECDVKYLEIAEFVIAIISGPDADSGTAWEMGYAYSKGKKVLSLVEDIRFTNRKLLNIMLSESSFVCLSIKELEGEIKAKLA